MPCRVTQPNSAPAVLVRLQHFHFLFIILIYCFARLEYKKQSHKHTINLTLCVWRGIMELQSTSSVCMYYEWIQKSWTRCSCYTAVWWACMNFFFGFIRLTRPTENWKLRDICITPWLFVFLYMWEFTAHTHSPQTNTIMH